MTVRDSQRKLSEYERHLNDSNSDEGFSGIFVMPWAKKRTTTRRLEEAFAQAVLVAKAAGYSAGPLIVEIFDIPTPDRCQLAAQMPSKGKERIGITVEAEERKGPIREAYEFD